MSFVMNLLFSNSLLSSWDEKLHEVHYILTVSCSSSSISSISPVFTSLPLWILLIHCFPLCSACDEITFWWSLFILSVIWDEDHSESIMFVCSDFNVSSRFIKPLTWSEKPQMLFLPRVQFFYWNAWSLWREWMDLQFILGRRSRHALLAHARTFN